MAEADLRKDIDALKKDLEQLRGDIGKLGGTLKSQAAGKASEAAQAVGDEVENLRAQLHDMLGRLESQGQEGMRRVGRQVEESPLTSLGIAFAVGFVIGRILDRR
jgi:ElaB/YqjD/DUF883 family membrane-anchored ribosome-binding protein